MQLFGAALGAAITVAATFWLTEQAAQRAHAEARTQLVQQLQDIRAEALKLSTATYPSALSEAEAGTLSKTLGRHCERLREAFNVLDYTLKNGIESDYHQLVGMFSVRRSLEWLVIPGDNNSANPPLLAARKAFFDMGDNPAAFHNTLAQISAATDELRLRLSNTLDSFGAGTSETLHG